MAKKKAVAAKSEPAAVEAVAETALQTTGSVNTQTGEIVEFDPASRFIYQFDLDVPEEGEIIYVVGMPLHIRADAKAGQFKIGEDQFLGKEMRMEIVKINLLKNVKLFNYPIQDWLQVFYVNSEDAVCHSLLKGNETMRNFQSLLLDLKIKRLDIHDSILIAKFVKREGTKRNADGTEETTQYYVLEFSFEKNDIDRIAKLQSFRADNDVFDTEIQASLNNWIRSSN